MAPIAYERFDLEKYVDFDTYLKDWMHINLYTQMRGANRFEALVNMLVHIHYPAEKMSHLKHWVENAEQLSMTSLREEMGRVGSQTDLQAALDWSQACNDGIHTYESEDYAAFSGVHEALAEIAEHGPIYVVSTANKPNISREWRENQIDEFVTEYRCQEAGPKRVTLAHFVEEGYGKENIIMIGDSPGDLKAAEQNGVHFYPILVGQETQSWQTFTADVLPAFMRGEMNQDTYTQLFKNHLSQ